MMKIGVTGHRPPRIGDKKSDIDFWIEEMLKNLKACYKDIELLTGMAKGVDQNVALIAIKMGIPFICYFPYRYKLSNEEELIVEQSERIIWCAEEYSGKHVYLDRDRKLVDDCDILLVVWDGQKTGGTYFTYKYAQEKGKNVFIYPWERGAAAHENKGLE